MLKATAIPYPLIKRHKEEETYINSRTGENEFFPSINDKPTLELSVIIPAFDEEKRCMYDNTPLLLKVRTITYLHFFIVPIMLDECMDYLEEKSKQNSKFNYEVIVVSDGSKDKTVQCALRYGERYSSDKFRVLDLIENRGKGGAVRLVKKKTSQIISQKTKCYSFFQGMQSSRGKYLLFADADGATKFSEFDKIEKSMFGISENWEDHVIVIGSRAHLEKESTAQRSFFRTILMHGFHLLVWLFAVRKIRDTQCGFKLLTRSSARIIFDIMHVERWAFDVELLFIAQSYKMKIDEIAVKWTEVDGSKVTPFWSWLQMGRDLILIWLRYTIGAWKLEKLHST